MKTEFKATLDKKAVSLETYVESRVNEVREETSSTLEQLKETATAVWESQKRMWWAIDGMTKDVQELGQRDVGTEDEENIEPLLAVENLAKEELAPVETTVIAQPTLEKTILA